MRFHTSLEGNTHIRKKSEQVILVPKSKACLRRGLWKTPLSKCSVLMHASRNSKITVEFINTVLSLVFSALQHRDAPN